MRTAWWLGFGVVGLIAGCGGGSSECETCGTGGQTGAPQGGLGAGGVSGGGSGGASSGGTSAGGNGSGGEGDKLCVGRPMSTNIPWTYLAPGEQRALPDQLASANSAGAANPNNQGGAGGNSGGAGSGTVGGSAGDSGGAADVGGARSDAGSSGEEGGATTVPFSGCRLSINQFTHHRDVSCSAAATVNAVDTATELVFEDASRLWYGTPVSQTPFTAGALVWVEYVDAVAPCAGFCAKTYQTLEIREQPGGRLLYYGRGGEVARETPQAILDEVLGAPLISHYDGCNYSFSEACYDVVRRPLFFSLATAEPQYIGGAAKIRNAHGELFHVAIEKAEDTLTHQQGCQDGQGPGDVDTFLAWPESE